MAYSKEDIFKKIVEIIKSNYYSAKDLDIQMSTPIKGGAIIDSLGLVLILVKIENFFKIHIPDRKWAKLVTMEDVVNTVFSLQVKS